MTRLTPAATISSSVALSNLLSGPAGGESRPLQSVPPSAAAVTAASVLASANPGVSSPKRRYSEATSDGSDGASNNTNSNGDNPRKSPRPNPQYNTPVRPPAEARSATAAQTASAEAHKPVQKAQNQSGQSGQRHAQARMRSSIACVRCRRSKVKCVNSGVGTPCRSCEAGGRDCTYPVPVSSGRRRESIVGQGARLEGLADDPVRRAYICVCFSDSGTDIVGAGAQTETTEEEQCRPSWATCPRASRDRERTCRCTGPESAHTLSLARVGAYHLHPSHHHLSQ